MFREFYSPDSMCNGLNVLTVNSYVLTVNGLYISILMDYISDILTSK